MDDAACTDHAFNKTNPPRTDNKVNVTIKLTVNNRLVIIFHLRGLPLCFYDIDGDRFNVRGKDKYKVLRVGRSI
jgi:hypothetical protein